MKKEFSDIVEFKKYINKETFKLMLRIEIDIENFMDSSAKFGADETKKAVLESIDVEIT